ncbi:hypothetical protein [Pectinatus frisingensis]|uniref:hypothetical protein n=1 Tax=Pectinatus frisingensis TaxID=865 RepID=UPI0018C5BB3C|nr:hypothetical protein [Pectinatus frisingensis]
MQDATILLTDGINTYEDTQANFCLDAGVQAEETTSIIYNPSLNLFVQDGNMIQPFTEQSKYETYITNVEKYIEAKEKRLGLADTTVTGGETNT